MKIRITKEEHDKLSDDLKKEFVEKDGGFDLKLEDEDGSDLGSLRSAKDWEKKRRQEAEKKVKDLEKANDELETKIHELETGSGSLAKDKEELEKKYKERSDREIAKVQKEIDRRDAELRRLTVESTASEIASRISTVPKAMERMLRDRLDVEWDGDRLEVRVLDADGKPSAITVAELEKEFISNKEFSGIIKGSQASGSGANPGSPAGGGAFNLADYQNEDKTVNWSKVAEAAKSDETVLAKVKEAANIPA